MSICDLKHLSVHDVVGVFDNVSSYDDLIDHIKDYGDNHGAVKNSDESDDAFKERVGKIRTGRVGMAFEVFCEFFFANYQYPHLGVYNIKHTSDDEYHKGTDFTATNANGGKVIVQAKFHGNPTFQFKDSELGTWTTQITMAVLYNGASKDDCVFFTNLKHQQTKSRPYGIFHFSYPEGLKVMRVIDRTRQEQDIDNDKNFWTDLATSVARSAQRPVIEKVPIMWDHQVQMNLACDRVMNLEITRGRVICATGGGKTRVEYLCASTCRKFRAVRCILDRRLTSWLELTRNRQTFGAFWTLWK